MKLMSAFLLVLAAAACAASPARNSSFYYYEPETATLVGFLTLGVNVDEAGREQHPYVLLLAKPISVAPRNKTDAAEFDVPKKGVKELQLFPASDAVDLAPLVGRTIRVTGTLAGSQGYAAKQYRDVVMRVKSVVSLDIHKDSRL